MNDKKIGLENLCIYCKEIIQIKLRSREHVVPEMLGLFGKDTMTLLDEVCRKCNNFFSRELELSFGRDSVFGILYRTMSGILRGDKFAKSIRHAREKLTLTVDYPIHGKILVNLAPANNPHIFNVSIADQFSLLNSTKGIRVNFPVAQIPHRGVLESLGLPMNSQVSFFGAQCDPDKLQSKIRKINLSLLKSDIKPKLNMGKVDNFPPIQFDSPLMFSSVIDDDIIRTIAKIGFNYFTYNFGYRFAISDYFNDIRNYVRYGLKPGYNIVDMTHHTINQHVYNLSKKSFGCHTISIYQEEKKIIAKIILFNRDSFKVTLTNCYPILCASFSVMHKFDILNKKVEVVCSA